MSLKERLKINLSCIGRDGGLLHSRAIPDGAEEGANADSLGAAFQSARQRQKVTIEQIAEDLKIPNKHIRALERGDLETLPAIPYVLGFVRSYAHYLKMDAVQCMRRFKEELPAGCEITTHSLPEARAEVRMPQGSMIILAVMMAIGIYGGWYALVRDDRMINGVSSLTDGLIKPTLVSNGRKDANENAATETSAALGQDATVGRPAIQYSPQKVKPTAESEGTEVAIDQKETSRIAALLAGVEEPIVVRADSRIVLNARSMAWIRMEDSENRTLMERYLVSGERYYVPDKPGLILSVRDAGAFEVIIDGQSIGFLGEAGQPLPTVSLDLRSLRLKKPF